MRYSVASLQRFVADVPPSSLFTPVSKDLLLLPFYDFVSKKTKPCIALVGWSQRSGSKPHVVVLAYEPSNAAEPLAFWCGDKYLEGTAPERMQDMIKELGVTGTVRLEVRDQMLVTDRAISRLPSGLQNGCAFASKGRCHHTDGLLSVSVSAAGDVQAIHDRMAAMFNKIFTPASAAAATGPLAPRTLAQIIAATCFRRPVLTLGERGAGKTYAAREFAATTGAHLVLTAGHASVEAADLFGCSVIGPGGVWLWKDGPMSEAWRRAARGERVVLMIDELLRIPARQQSALLTALSPDAAGNYHLRTGRLVGVEDGIGIEEVLVAPRERLGIIATSNVGADYQVSALDPAVAGRFKIVEAPTTRQTLATSLKAAVAARGFRANVTAALLAFYDHAVAKFAPDVRDNTRLSIRPCVRTLTAVVELADRPQDIPLLLREEFPQWTTRDMSGTLAESDLKLLGAIASKTVDGLLTEPAEATAGPAPASAAGWTLPDGNTHVDPDGKPKRAPRGSGRGRASRTSTLLRPVAASTADIAYPGEVAM